MRRWWFLAGLAGAGVARAGWTWLDAPWWFPMGVGVLAGYFVILVGRKREGSQ